MDFFRDTFGLGMPDVIPSAGGAGYSAEYQAVYDSFTNPPPTAVADAQNTMVESLVAAGIWAKLDVFYLFANYWPDDGLINWINPGTNNATAVNAPGFISYEGYTAASLKYIDLNYATATHGVNYTQNDSSAGLYCRTDPGSG